MKYCALVREAPSAPWVYRILDTDDMGDLQAEVKDNDDTDDHTPDPDIHTDQEAL